MRPVELPPAPKPEPLTDPLSLAVIAEMSEYGYPDLDLDAVLVRAGITAAEFRRRYVDLDECVLDTYERLTATTARRIGDAFNRQADWRSALRAAAYEVADMFVEHPHTVRFGISEILRMGNEMARVRREEVFVFCAQLVERGREAASDPDAVPEGAEIVATGSIIQLLTRRLQEGAEIDFHESARESIYGVVRVYLGDAAAREELAMPRPASPVAATH